MEIDYRFAQDEYAGGLFCLNFVAGDANVADVFTKYKGYTIGQFTELTDTLLRGVDMD